MSPFALMMLRAACTVAGDQLVGGAVHQRRGERDENTEGGEGNLRGTPPFSTWVVDEEGDDQYPARVGGQ
jgi:hypothetical protein